MHGAKKFLDRVWRLFIDDDDKLRDRITTINDGRLTKIYNQTVKKVSDDFGALHYNTGISQLMVFVNEAQKVDDLPVAYVEGFVQLLAPIAPHMAEELWQKLGHDTSAQLAPWPKYDPSQLTEDTAEIIVQVNGKMRGKFSVARDTPKDELEKQALANEHVQKFIGDGTVRKVITIPNKIVNIVVK
jgi:leucyl-tRNA synthetase